MVRLKLELAGQNRARVLTRSLVTQSVNTVDTAVQQLERNAVDWLRQRLECAYSTVRLPCLVDLAAVSDEVATSIFLNSDEGEEDRWPETAESRLGETRHDSMTAFHPLGSC